LANLFTLLAIAGALICLVTPAISADRLLYQTGYDRALWVENLDGTNKQKITVLPDWVSGSSVGSEFSPSNKAIAFWEIEGSKAAVVNLVGPTNLWVIDCFEGVDFSNLGGGFGLCLGWNNKQDKLYIARSLDNSEDGGIFLLRPGSKKPERFLSGDTTRGSAMLMSSSADGSKLIVNGGYWADILDTHTHKRLYSTGLQDNYVDIVLTIEDHAIITFPSGPGDADSLSLKPLLVNLKTGKRRKWPYRIDPTGAICQYRSSDNTLVMDFGPKMADLNLTTGRVKFYKINPLETIGIAGHFKVVTRRDTPFAKTFPLWIKDLSTGTSRLVAKDAYYTHIWKEP